MGTPDFAVPSLKNLVSFGHEVVGVFTGGDKPRGRGHRVSMSAVKAEALRMGLGVYEPVSLRNGEIQEGIKALSPDVIVVAAYGKILPEEVLKIPRLGCVNVHGSLLPKYRGAAPVQRAVMGGEKITGVTTMLMDAGLDTGKILLQAETEVDREETSGELFERLSILGADLLIETLKKMETGEIVPVPQDEALSSYAPRLKKEESILDWNMPAERLHDIIRGLNPWPCAVANLSGKKIKIFSTRVKNGRGEPGELGEIKGELWVFCGDGALKIEELQPENGRRMSGEDYLRGHPLAPGSRFE